MGEQEIETYPESHEVLAYLTPKPGEAIEWLADVEDFICTYAYS